jgi:hypothetical protein
LFGEEARCAVGSGGEDVFAVHADFDKWIIIKKRRIKDK